MSPSQQALLPHLFNTNNPHRFNKVHLSHYLTQSLKLNLNPQTQVQMSSSPTNQKVLNKKQQSSNKSL
jgi:hypothetical protein